MSICILIWYFFAICTESEWLLLLNAAAVPPVWETFALCSIAFTYIADKYGVRPKFTFVFRLRMHF